MLSYVGTTDFRVICKRAAQGDPKFSEAYQALVYQLAKDIGAMAAAYVGRVAPIIRLPGEEEMRALAEGALRVLHGEQEASVY